MGIKKKLENKNGSLEPKKVKCSCGNEFFVKFVISQQDWSKKNNLGYWTEQEKDKENYKCGECLRQFYNNKVTYWQAVQNSKKRALFRVYLSSGCL